MSLFLIGFTFAVVAAFFGGLIARRANLPPILGYLTSGILFGVIGRIFFVSSTSLESLFQLVTGFLLFTLGLSMPLNSLKNLNRQLILVALSQFIATIVIFLPSFFFLGLRLETAFLFSILFTFSSAAVAIKALEEKGIIKDFPGNNILILLIIQSLFIIPIAFLLPILFSQSFLTLAAMVQVLMLIIKAFAIFLSILFFVKILLPRIFRWSAGYPAYELNLLAMLFTVSLSLVAFLTIGMPITVAAFASGIIIAEQSTNTVALRNVKPFRDLMLVLFFVMAGVLVDFQFLLEKIWLVAGLAVFLIVAKLLIFYIFLRFLKYTAFIGIFIAFYLSNIGELSVIVAQITFLSNYIGQEDYNLFLSVFIVSLILISFGLKYFNSIVLKLSSLRIFRVLVEDARYYKILQKQEMENHVIICGYDKIGRQATKLLDQASILYVVIDFDRKVISELEKSNKFAFYADPSSINALKEAAVEKAKVLIVTIQDRFLQKRIITQAMKENPDIIVLCRSDIEQDHYDLLNMGVNVIVIPEIEAGIKMGEEILEVFKVKNEEAEKIVRKIRKQNIL